MERLSYLVPDYYPDFHCKMGDCRNACCQGWPVSIDRDKYFQLLGADCPQALRQKLDCAMYLCDYPTPQRYAQLNHRFDGNCSLRDPDGRCGLQVVMGEEILPDVCRLYPRGIRGTGEERECSCSNSCEAVPELFWDRKAPIRFQRLPLDLLPPASFDCGCGEACDLAALSQQRLAVFALLQDRSLSLPQRFYRLGTLFTEESSSSSLSEPTEEALLCALEQIAEVLRQTEAHSDSLHAYAPTVLEAWDTAADPLALYRKGRDAWEALCPQWEIFFEHLFINHAFFLRFPMEEGAGSPKEQADALCLLYALLRFFLCLSCLQAPSREDAVDRIAAVFRLVAHTDFARYAKRLEKQMGFTEEERVAFLAL